MLRRGPILNPPNSETVSSAFNQNSNRTPALNLRGPA